jgi:uncharacterized membrane protein (UPF0127 family)
MGRGPTDRVRWQEVSHGLQIRVARTFHQRLLGLRAYACWGTQPWGLLLPDCRAVHTVGLAQAVDLVFLEEQGRILEALVSVPPNRCAWRWQARAVLELPAGYCAAPGWCDQVSEAWRSWKMDA